MKRISTVIIATLIVTVALNAGGFEKRFKMMESRIQNKMEKVKGNAKAVEFLNQKLECVKAASDEASLKDCKKKFHPKAFKKLM